MKERKDHWISQSRKRETNFMHLWYVYSETSVNPRTLHANEDSQVHTSPSWSSALKQVTIRTPSLVQEIQHYWLYCLTSSLLLQYTYLLLQSAHSLFSGNLRSPSNICKSEYQKGDKKLKLASRKEIELLDNDELEVQLTPVQKPYRIIFSSSGECHVPMRIPKRWE